MDNLSKKEQFMFAQLGFGHLMHILTETALYRMAVEEHFIKNTQNKYADSLRRCYKAIQSCSPYRLTKEFDDLIEE